MKRLAIFWFGFAFLHGVAQEPTVVDKAQAGRPFLGAFRFEVKGGMVAPAGLAGDARGRLYTIDRKQGNILVMDGKGNPLQRLKGARKMPLALRWGGDVAVLGKRLAVTDAGHDCLFLMRTSGHGLKRIGASGQEPGRFRQPWGVDMQAGLIAVADSGNDRIQLFDRKGSLMSAFGSSGSAPGQLRRPMGVALLPAAGKVFVADSGNHRVQVFDLEGHFLSAWGEWGPHPGFFDDPTALRLVGSNLYVCDRRNHRVQVFDQAGTLLQDWGVHELDPHEGQGLLHYPTQIFPDPDRGLFFLTEPLEDRIQAFRMGGQAEESRPGARRFSKQVRAHVAPFLDCDGPLFVQGEPENDFVVLFTLETELPVAINQFGERGEAFGLFHNLESVSLDYGRRKILVADNNLRRLQVFRFSHEAGERLRNDPLRTQFIGAVDYAVLERQLAVQGIDATLTVTRARWGIDGALDVLDAPQGRLFSFSSDFKLTGMLGAADSSLRHASDFVRTEDGRTFVVDAELGQIQCFDTTGKYYASLGAGLFDCPFGIARDGTGRFFVTDRYAHTVVVMDSKGTKLQHWGGKGSEHGLFWRPAGVDLDQSGRVYVSDYGNHRIQVFNQEGQWQATFSGQSRVITPKNQRKTPNDQ